MTHEKLEELGCGCGSTMRSTRDSGWLCIECGAQFSITGRSLKNISRLHFYEPGYPSGYYPHIADRFVEYSETDWNTHFLIDEAFRSLDMSRDDNGGDEVPG